MSEKKLSGPCHARLRSPPAQRVKYRVGADGCYRFGDCIAPARGKGQGNPPHPTSAPRRAISREAILSCIA